MWRTRQFGESRRIGWKQLKAVASYLVSPNVNILNFASRRRLLYQYQMRSYGVPNH